MPSATRQPRLVSIFTGHCVPREFVAEVAERLKIPNGVLALEEIRGERPIVGGPEPPSSTFDRVVVEVHELWLEVPLGAGWIAAYRFVVHDRVPLVAEVRVFPAEPDRSRSAGHWSADVLGAGARVPKGGVTRRLLREVPVPTRHRALIGAILEEWQGAHESLARAMEEAWPRFNESLPKSWRRPRGERPRLAESVKRGRGPKFFLSTAPPLDPRALGRQVQHHPGRGGREPTYYAQVAQVYAAAVTEGDNPAKCVAEWMGIHRSASAVRSLIHRTRRLGYLSPTMRGRAGGQLTDLAREVLGMPSSTAEASALGRVGMAAAPPLRLVTGGRDQKASPPQRGRRPRKRRDTKAR